MEADVESEATARLEDVYRRESAKLWRAVALSTGNVDVASDAVAEAFAQAMDRGSSIQDPAAWVWKTAFRIAGREMKRARTTERLVADVAEESRTGLVELVDALGALTWHQRASVVLADFAGYHHAEIARVIGSTPAAVAVHVHRGRRRLRELLGDDDA